MTLILTPKDNGKVIDLGGQVSLNFATLADGSCVIAHGLSGTPSFINYTIKSSTPIHLQRPHLTRQISHLRGLLLVVWRLQQGLM